jgi:hypothetical protein
MYYPLCITIRIAKFSSQAGCHGRLKHFSRALHRVDHQQMIELAAKLVAMPLRKQRPAFWACGGLWLEVVHGERR